MNADWRPTATRRTLEARAAMLARARTFFAERRILEVDTPTLGAGGTTDPQIESLSTHVSGIASPLYLATSPEFAMKRLLAAGSGPIYQIGKVFRDEEYGRWHNPEFTMIEWYRPGLTDAELMSEVEALVGELLEPHRPLRTALRLTYAEALERHAGVADAGASVADLRRAAAAHGIDCDAALDRDGALDLLMGLVVGPRLGRDAPCFVTDYPASQASLARLRPGDPRVAARFELYLDGIELANGFHELCDAREQRLRFESDLSTRCERGQPLPAIDRRLLEALEAGLPDCAGVALGFDRLVALAIGADALRDALAFPVDRA